MNPCPCGYYGDPTHECTCSQRNINHYLGKISGPLLDRMDIHMEVTPVDYKDLEDTVTLGEPSKLIKERVDLARERQLERFKNDKIFSNSQLSSKHMKKYCKIDDKSSELMKEAFEKMGFSARAYNKILKVARTIADLDNKDFIESHHLAEALQYRSLDRKFWR